MELPKEVKQNIVLFAGNEHFMMCQCKPLSLANMTDWCYAVRRDRKMCSKLQFQISSNVKLSAYHSLKKKNKEKCIDFITRKSVFSLIPTNKC